MKTILLFLLCSISLSGQMDKDEATKLVHSFLKAWETNDTEAMEATLHEDALFAYPGDRLDKTEFLEMFEAYQEDKKDIKIYLWDTFLLDGDRFATAYQFAATDIETGKRQAVSTGITGRIADGQLLLIKEYWDEEVSTLQYTGKLPLDEGLIAPWPATIWLRPETID